MIKTGQIIYWSDFPLQTDGNLKGRYFLYLGISSIFDTPILVNLITTTSQIHYYKSGAKREKAVVFFINRNKYSFFTTDCLIDFNLGYQTVNQDTLMTANIEVKGEFSLEDLTVIFNKLIRAGSVQIKNLREIRQRLEEIGCKNLALVKSNR
jgi:hypothetical protein